MTWEFQATISDDVYSVIGPAGEVAWGIDNGDVDAESPAALGTAEVALPTGRRTLLLVPALPGGFVLDVVRAYQGLTDSELCTLFLGIVTELRDCTRAEERLSLRAFALDAAGRPVLIPGITTALVTSPRRALGEMLYHAGVGRPWAECLLPVNLALADSSPTLRAVVADLLAESSADAGLSAALAEVSEAMRTLAVPAPLPLVPADRDLAPEAALTARLRAASGHPLSRRRQQHADVADGTAEDLPAEDRPELGLPTEVRRAAVGMAPLGSESGTAVADAETSSGPAAAVTAHHGSAALTLRAASRRSQRRRAGPRPRTPMPAVRRWVAERLGSRWSRFASSFRRRRLVAAALCLTLVGGFVIWRSWATADSAQPTAAENSQSAPPPHAEPSSEKEPSPQGEPNDAGDISAKDVAEVLTGLCADRAQALSDGDAAALSELTVPGSAAAAADELIDHAMYIGSDYSIEVDDVKVIEAGRNRIVASASMHSSAGTGSEAEDFGTLSVEFVLKRLDDTWRVEQVMERTNPS